MGGRGSRHIRTPILRLTVSSAQGKVDSQAAKKQNKTDFDTMVSGVGVAVGVPQQVLRLLIYDTKPQAQATPRGVRRQASGLAMLRERHHVYRL